MKTARAVGKSPEPNAPATQQNSRRVEMPQAQKMVILA